MSSIVYFLNNFNNYYNRIIKKYNSISDYLTAVGEENYAVRGDSTNIIHGNKGPVNFNINDGVNAVLTYNYDPNQDWQPNYILVCDVDNITIKSRWFVIEAKRTRQGQYRLNLHRDTIADNYDAVVKSTSMIENATVNKNSPYIYNSENNTYNQIKKSETLLKDETGCGWCIGFGTKRNPDTGTSKLIKANISHEITGGTYNMSSTEFQSLYKSFIVTDISKLGVGFYARGQQTKMLMENWFNYKGSGEFDISWTGKLTSSAHFHEEIKSDDIRERMNLQMPTILTAAKNLWESFYKSYDILSDIPSYYYNLNNTFIKLNDGVYSVKFKRNSISNNRSYTIYNNATVSSDEFWTTFVNAITATSGTYGTTDSNNYKDVYLQCDGYQYDLILIDVTEGQCRVEIGNDMVSLTDAPYYMFAIPYGDINIKIPGLDVNKTTAQLAINTAIAIQEQSQWMEISDIQLVPFCPCREYWKNNTLDLTGATNIEYQAIYDDDYSLFNVVIWCTQSKGSFDINNNIPVETDDIEFKVQNETEFYRLNSPNYNGVYEFKATMNGGIDAFNVDYWYKPGQPYIHINPKFNSEYLYGDDYNDARGLICQGDFSLPRITDQWIEYVKNNINYQNSFNRNIQNQETNRKLERINQAVGAVAGTVFGATNGAKLGAGGAIGGAVGVAAAGVADMALSEYSYNEQISYATDQFNYQLGNVKALGDAITNVGAYNNNNKIFPFIEKWTCTDEEKEALRKKLNYQGMNVGVVDYIVNYLRDDYTFIRAKLIRFEDSGDMHLVATIAEELQKGVYLKNDTE